MLTPQDFIHKSSQTQAVSLRTCKLTSQIYPHPSLQSTYPTPFTCIGKTIANIQIFSVKDVIDRLMLRLRFI